MKKLILICSILLFANILKAQLPDCAGVDSNKVFNHTNGITRYDPTLPISGTNPSAFAANGGGGGLSISQNLNGGPASPTFYSSIGGLYYYYDGATWISTGHTSTSVNPGGGMANIFSIIGGSGQIYKYDGTGPNTLLTTVPGSGPYDVETDVNDNWYVLRTNVTPGSILQYDPGGTLLNTITVNANPIQTAGGGFAMVGNLVVACFNTSPSIYTGTIAANSVTLAPVGSFSASDMATCPASNFAAPPNAAFSLSQSSICAGDCITVTDLSSGSPTNWSWSFPGGNPSSATGQVPPTICYNTPGTYTLTLIATNAVGSDTAEEILVVVPFPTASIVGNLTICEGQSTTLTANPINGVNYLWNTTDISQSITVSPTVTTTYTVYVENGLCSDSAVATVTVISVNADFDFDINLGCENDTVIFTNLSTGNNLSTWQFGDGYFSGSTNPTHIYLTQGIYNVTLIAGFSPCADTISKTINVLHPIRADMASTLDSICLTNPLMKTSGASLPLYPGVRHTWIWGDGNISSGLLPTFGLAQNHQYAAPGTYNIILIVEDTLGCIDSTFGTVYVEDTSSANFILMPDKVCVGSPVYFYETMSPEYKFFTWDFGNGPQDINKHNPTNTWQNPGLYNVTLSVVYPICGTIDVVKPVEVFAFSNVNLGPDTMFCPDITQPISLFNINNPSEILKWSTGENSPSITALKEGIFWATGTNEICSSTDTIQIFRDCYLNIPNAFTPNADGDNDYFLPRQLLSAGLTSFKMDIFNRWGELIFSTTSLNGRGWDGKYNDVPQPMGVFIYNINAEFKNKVKRTFTGNVTLLR